MFIPKGLSNLNFFGTLGLIIFSTSIIGQNKQDCCALLPGVKAFISSADSSTIPLIFLKNGFTLSLSDTGLKITSFNLAFIAPSKNGGDEYIVSSYEGDKFDPNKYPEIRQQIEKAKTIFIDNISANRGDSCYLIRPLVYQIK
jgi:hypothetical protein